MVLRTYSSLSVLILLLLLSACQPKVYLMPAPVGIDKYDGFPLLATENVDENLLYTLYATNRIPFNKTDGNTGYTIFPSDTLELGYLVYSVGEESMSWEELYKQSLKQKRSKELQLIQKLVKPMAKYHKNDDLLKTSARAEGFFHQIDEVLKTSLLKEITIYVHGANSNFYRATAQGAQLYHFTGHNSIILTFSWPSAENLLKYKVDVMHARKTIPAFGHLLELLALHTRAEKINIIAYSAGAQVVAPGLAALPELFPKLSETELKEKLRIGEVYFAAPDTAFKAFVDRYLRFRHLVDRTTITLNANDKILLLAAMQNGTSRLGRPDTKELNKDETRMLIDAVNSPDLDIIDAGGSKALDLGSGHDYWYNNSWVSTDLLMLLFFNASPEERGLVAGTSEKGADMFYFPSDYTEVIPSLIQKQKEKLLYLRSHTGAEQ